MAGEKLGPQAGPLPDENARLISKGGVDRTQAESSQKTESPEKAESSEKPESLEKAAATDGTPAATDRKTAATDGAAAATDGSQPPSAPVRHRKLLYVTLPGSWGALLFACLSFTPSLLPRGGLIQGVICGITAAIGYGLGVLAASIWRAFADRGPRRPRRIAWRAFFVMAIILFAASFALGQYWQYEIRGLMGVTEYSVPLAVISPIVAFVVFGVILVIGRGLRGLYRTIAQLLGRWMGRRAANAVGWILVAGVTYLVVTGLLLQGLVSLANDAFSVRDTTTPPGVQQPATSLHSGGPGSLVPWDTLGWQGRKFAGAGPESGPSADEIAKFSHHTAMEPIRAYVGLASAPDTESRAVLAVKELRREGGFNRKNLLVVTTTGSGWVDPALVDSFEYLTGGDSATVAIQYSYLPSWISYLVDQSKAREAGRALFDVVYGAWSGLPQGHRPRIFVAGESLGSFGGEAAFSGEYDLHNRTAGATFAGPPSFNTLFREFSDNRDPGSPEVQPVYQDGRIVRFASDSTAGIPPAGRPWDGSRVLYMMHSSDPIVWWSPRLILRQPDWISEPGGKDVLPGMYWMPFVTFWQVTADLPFSTAVPAGHGHKYTSEYVDGWNAVIRPAGISPQDLASLRKIIAAVG